MIIKIISRKIFLKYAYLIFLIKKRLPKTLYYRTILIISTTVLLVQVLGAVIFYDNYWRHVRRLLINNLTNNIANIVNQANETNDDTQINVLLEKIKQYSALNPQLVHLTQRYNLLTPSNTNTKFLSEELRKKIPNSDIFITEYGDNYSIVKLSVRIKDNSYISFYLEKELFFIKSIVSLAALMFTMYILCILITIQFIRLQIRPLYKLSKYAKMLGRGEKVPYINPAGSVEIRETTIAFNEMSSQIQQFIEQRTMLLSSVSHDLKTSLTKMNLILDTNAKHPLSDDLKEEIDNMYQMIISYLNFAKDDSIQYEKKSVNIKEFFKNIVKNTNYQGRNITLSLEQTQKYIDISPLLLKRAIDNLINNALFYSSKVDITVNNSGHHNLMISIEDDGTGIPEESRDLVFKPFYKINEARTAHKGSVGLGLYIVKDIITKHGGNIKLKDSKYGGLKVDISIPF